MSNYHQLTKFLNKYLREYKRENGAAPHSDVVYLEPNMFDTKLFEKLFKEEFTSEDKRKSRSKSAV